MAYEFKKLSDVEVVAEPMETANVLIEEDGVIKKAPKTAVGGDALLKLSTYAYPNTSKNYISDLQGNEVPIENVIEDYNNGIVRFRLTEVSGGNYNDTHVNMLGYFLSDGYEIYYMGNTGEVKSITVW